LFARFHEQLAGHGYVARNGQMVDATFVEVPRQRNNREENALIKEDAVPIEWGKSTHKLAQKDTDARWTKKNNENHYGFKNHINADQEHKLIQAYTVTDAAVHDSQVFDELLDQTEDAEGNKRAVYADSAYRSKATEEKLSQDGITSQICEKGTRAAALTEEQKEANRKKSKVRARVEHVFGAQNAMGGHLVRTIGLLRAQVKIGMMNLVYNMVRLMQLLKRDAKMTG
jgi:IS5 family transposase